jgi:hypothetical protein
LINAIITKKTNSKYSKAESSETGGAGGDGLDGDRSIGAAYFERLDYQTLMQEIGFRRRI